MTLKSKRSKRKDNSNDMIEGSPPKIRKSKSKLVEPSPIKLNDDIAFSTLDNNNNGDGYTYRNNTITSRSFGFEVTTGVEGKVHSMTLKGIAKFFTDNIVLTLDEENNNKLDELESLFEDVFEKEGKDLFDRIRDCISSNNDFTKDMLRKPLVECPRSIYNGNETVSIKLVNKTYGVDNENNAIASFDNYVSVLDYNYYAKCELYLVYKINMLVTFVMCCFIHCQGEWH